MGKRGRILIAVATVALLAMVVWRMLPAPEPVYDGKPYSYWLAQIDPTNLVHPQDKAYSAIIQIGTNGVPILLQMIRSQDSPLKAKIINWAAQHRFPWIRYTATEISHRRAEEAFSVLGYRATGAVPELINIFDKNASWESEYSAAVALGNIGPEAKAAVPSLLRGAGSPNAYVRLCAI
jgi:hypothetical protein